ncbi:hypothetical protein HA391_26035 [Escherichia coli]|nr:hypothetical protein [Escherichia coli]
MRRLAAFLLAGTIAGPSLLEPQQLQTRPVTSSSTMRPGASRWRQIIRGRLEIASR